MRKFVVAAAIAAFGFGGAANAADMPVKAAPITPAPTISSWEGFYIGISGGYGWSDRDVTFTGGNALGTTLINSGFWPASLGVRTNGGLAGAQLGYNHVFNNNMLLGAEIDGSFAWLKGSTSRIFNCAGVEFCNTFVERSLTSLGTLRARLGWLVMPSTLLYGTGGLAVGRTRTWTRYEDNLPGAPSSAETATSRTAAGWTAGVGIERQITRQWSVKAEYLYVNLGSNSHATQLNSANFVANWRDTFNIIRAGLNYHF